MSTPTTTRTTVGLLSLVLAFSALPARAQVQHDRGTILNIDLRALQVQIKDAKDRERIWPLAKDATVKFSDKAWTNRSASLKDLRQGMYVHFTYSSGEPEVIQDFDVKDVGKGGAPTPAPNTRPAEGQTGKVTAVDPRVAQIEVMLDRGGRKTFQAANASVLNGVRPGQRVTLVTESRGGQDVVVQVKR